VNVPGFSDGREKVPCQVPVKSRLGAVGVLPHAWRLNSTTAQANLLSMRMIRWDRHRRILSGRAAL
jgi:hypothetical protein